MQLGVDQRDELARGDFVAPFDRREQCIDV
jgi:hypothetical protein